MRHEGHIVSDIAEFSSIIKQKPSKNAREDMLFLYGQKCYVHNKYILKTLIYPGHHKVVYNKKKRNVR